MESDFPLNLKETQPERAIQPRMGCSPTLKLAAPRR